MNCRLPPPCPTLSPTSLEIDGDYDRVRFDGVAFDAAAASGARFTESAFIGGSFDEGRLRKARFTDVWFEQTRLVAVDVAGALYTDAWFNGCVFAGVQAFTCVSAAGGFPRLQARLGQFPRGGADRRDV